MRMTWARRKASPSPGVDRMHFVMWDFLKMFMATVICGLAVALAAAGLAMVLANDVFAATTSVGSVPGNSIHGVHDADGDSELRAHPGTLMINTGCDAEALAAADRDWKVTIQGKFIDIRVMQTFIVPSGDASAATFNALLPKGGRLLRLTAHTNGNVWQGKVFDARTHDQLTSADFRNLSRKGMLIVQNDNGAVSTEPIINIAAGEAVTVEYTYRVATEDTNEQQNLFVALANVAISPDAAAGESETSGTVWVEWVGNHPSRLTQVPSGAFLETAGPRITGLSWSAPQLNMQAGFQLAWAK